MKMLVLDLPSELHPLSHAIRLAYLWLNVLERPCRMVGLASKLALRGGTPEAVTSEKWDELEGTAKVSSEVRVRSHWHDDRNVREDQRLKDPNAAVDVTSMHSRISGSLSRRTLHKTLNQPRQSHCVVLQLMRLFADIDIF